MGFVKSFAFQQDNSKHKPNEDAHYCVEVEFEGNHSFAVADGVSRAVYGDARYPFSAWPAAEAFCKIAASALVSGIPTYTSFAGANDEIAAVNKKAGITPETVDYLGLDYLCCEGIAGLLHNEPPYRFFYGYIGDCGILVYDHHLLPLFLSDNPIGILEQFREGFEFEDKSDQRLFWRQKLRNHPDRRFMTHGALTGEASALSYLKTGSIDLEPGDTVIMFSDGIYPFIFDHWFRHLVASLLRSTSGEELRNLSGRELIGRTLGSYIMRACPKLEQQGVGNLDDDKTFIALTVD